MQTGQSVGEWVGKRVQLNVLHDGKEPRHFRCTLEGISDKGVIAHYDTKKDADQTRFFPWHLVLHIHLVKEEDERQEDH